jgi:drug/metabolite transporter (DMT)-like permease
MNNFVLTVLLVLMTAVWGWTFTIVKDATAVYGTVAFLAVRFTIGFLCLSIFSWRRLSLKSLLVGGGIGITLALGYLFQTLGLRYTTPTNSGLITSLLVVAAPLFNRMLFGVRTRPLLWVAIGLTLLGLVLLTGTGLGPLASGDLLTLAAAISFGLQVVFLDRYSKHHDTLSLTIGQTAMSAIIFLAAWPMTTQIAWPSYNVWKAILLTGIIATALGFYVQTLAQKQLPTARVVVIISLEAVFAMFFGYLLAGDRLTPVQLLGALFMLAAVAMAEIVPVLCPVKEGMRQPVYSPSEENSSL